MLAARYSAILRSVRQGVTTNIMSTIQCASRLLAHGLDVRAHDVMTTLIAVHGQPMSGARGSHP